MEKRIKELMTTLKISREEAIELINEDMAIDKMSMKELNADLTKEQKEAIKQATKTGTRKPTASKRERKVDETKKRLINGFRVFLEGLGAKVEPLKTEAEMHFTFEGAEYTVKLIKHRKRVTSHPSMPGRKKVLDKSFKLCYTITIKRKGAKK